jgi:exodeoxyribonuclease III
MEEQTVLPSIVTWNVNSIAARLPHVLNWLQARQPDVVCLQEIKCIEEKYPAAEIAAVGYRSLVYGQPTYNGVAILVREGFLTENNAEITDVQKGFADDTPESHRRLIAATIGGVRVVNVYVPNGQAVGTEKYAFKLDWCAKLRQFLDTTADPTRPLALCGDFNVAMADIDVFDPKAWKGKILFSDPEKEAMRQLMAWGLRDAFRELYPDTQLFSWWDYRLKGFDRNLGLRIDHIWLTDSLFGRCKAVEIDREPRSWERPSDHTPVVAKF